jgi:ABC-type branched-subunit amino acid transport system ATPase component
MSQPNLHGSPLLEVSGLQTAYGTSQVLFGLDVRIAAGEVATLLGRNGMGKTTTVRSMLGLTRSNGGEVRFLGERIDGLTPDRIARMGLAVVPEGRQIFPNLSVQENLVAFAANGAMAAATPGRWSACTACSRAWPSGGATWATSCQAASSRCWPLAARS